MKTWILALSLLISHTALAAIKGECGQARAGTQAYTWCIYKPELASKNPDILYYLHGGSNSAESYGEDDGFGEFLNQAWSKIGADAPTVITLSFGPRWLLGDVPTADHPALLPLVTNQILPALEARVGGLKGRRLLAGHSMGGYNSSELGMREAHLFDRVAMLCPGALDIDPFATDKDVEDFIKRQPSTVNPDAVRGLVAWVRREFPTPEVWARHDPLQIAAHVKGKPTKYYVSCTKDDPYGFYPAAEKTAAILRRHGVDAKFVSIESGGHCAESLESTDSLAHFLTDRE